MRSYEPSEFISQLAAGQLAEPLDLTLYGLVKADESDSSVLHFSASTSCEQWLPIPVAMISSVAHVRNVKCKDHQHPLAKITLAEPEKEDASAFLFMKLFAQTRANARTRMASSSGKLASQACEILEFDDVPYLCCGGECWILSMPGEFSPEGGADEFLDCLCCDSEITAVFGGAYAAQ